MKYSVHFCQLKKDISKFHVHLLELGFNSYDQYLNSEHWAHVKLNYKNDQHLLQECVVCGSKIFQLHHISYKNLGIEHLKELIPLCRFHHKKVHEIIKEKAMTLKGGTYVAVTTLIGVNIKKIKKKFWYAKALIDKRITYEKRKQFNSEFKDLYHIGGKRKAPNVKEKTKKINGTNCN